jgi:capsular polysaccharide transport system permease protein
MTTSPPDGPAAAPPKPRPELRAVETGPAPAAVQAAVQAAARTAPAAPKPAKRPPRPKPAARPAPAAPPAARLRLRHWAAILGFLALVALPFAAAVVYLETRAADRYHSDVAFSVRSEDAGAAAAGLIGAITSIGGGSASDADILYEYVRSQAIVEAIDAELDLRAIWGRAADDPVFTIAPDAPVEALVAHWRRMVDVAFESGAGIIHVRVQAFTPEDARAVAAAVLAQSSALVNRLSDQAREDAVRFAREELAEAEANLREMRARLSAFRRENRLVDPSADVAGQMGLLNALQAELAQALVERDVLLSFVGEQDQRVIQAGRRIDAVGARIEAERASLGAPGTEGVLPDVVGRYEELLVDLEFANTAYTQALAGLAAARAEARRQSRYLAPHVRPTLAESALFPRRTLLAGLVALFLLLGWSAVMLVYYNVRDTR